MERSLLGSTLVASRVDSQSAPCIKIQDEDDITLRRITDCVTIALCLIAHLRDLMAQSPFPKRNSRTNLQVVSRLGGEPGAPIPCLFTMEFPERSDPFIHTSTNNLDSTHPAQHHEATLGICVL